MNLLKRKASRDPLFAWFSFVFLVLLLAWPGDLFASSDDDSRGVEKSGAEAETEAFKSETLGETIQLIKDQYYDPSLLNHDLMFRSALKKLALAVPPLLIDFNGIRHSIVLTMGKNTKMLSAGQIDSFWKLQCKLDEVIKFINDNSENPDELKRVEGAIIDGLMDTMDPHSVYLSTELSQRLDLMASNNIVGLGFVLEIKQGRLIVVMVIKNTPAWRAGIKKDDWIQTIDGESTRTLSLSSAIEKLEGERGASIRLGILRKGWRKRQTIALAHDVIEIPSVRSRLMKNSIGYLRLNEFTSSSVREMKTALVGMQVRRPLKGLILDLRDNPGGLIHTAVKMGDLFIGDGRVVTVVGPDDEDFGHYDARLMGTEAGYPIVILINGQTASASELVSGALRKRGKVLLVGEQSFGKGSIQNVYRLGDSIAMKMTVYQYKAAADVSIQASGLNPDIELIPVRVEKSGIRWMKSDRLREADLDRHLPGKPDAAQSPVEEIRFLSIPKRDDSDGKDYDEKINTKSFSVQFAHHLLTAAVDSRNREEMLRQAEKMIAATKRAEEEKILKKLEKQDIDWSFSAEEQSRNVSTDAMHVELSIDSELTPGKSAVMNLTVRNDNQSDLPRVRAVSSSDNPDLDDIEFIFGRLRAGDSKSVKRKIKVDADSPRRSDDILISVYNALSDKPGRLKKRIDVAGVEQPQFAYCYQVIASKGNRDGRIQAGEKVELIVDVENIGKGKVRKGFVALKAADALGGLHIKDANREINNLESGGRIQLSFELNIEKNIEKEQIPVRIVIVDTASHRAASELIHLLVEPEQRWKRAKRGSGIKLAAGARIYGSPNTGYPYLLELKKERVLSVQKIAEGWVKVKINREREGWAQIPAGARPIRKRGKSDLKIANFRRASDIKVENSDNVVYTDAASIVLKGLALSENSIQDVFVIRNDEKVYFMNSDGSESAGKMAFSPEIELDAGSNWITIVVRESDRQYTSLSMLVHRSQKESDLGSSETAEKQ